MKRDMDLVREILMELSESSEPLDASSLADGRRSREDVAYHFEIMDEAGLIKASVRYAENGPCLATASRLTWDGNEFLDAVRSDTVWMP